MDTTPPYPTARRRITRTVPGPNESTSTASSLQAGPSRLPDLTQLVDVNYSALNQNYDTESDDVSTPRVPISNHKPPLASGETPAARLRALNSLIRDNTAVTSVPPPPPQEADSTAEYDSDFDMGESINATASMARESLRDIFSRALRPPGGTPQKQHKRRNSIDASDLESSVNTEQGKSKRRGQRKSLSDEEVENSHRMLALFQHHYHSVNSDTLA